MINATARIKRIRLHQGDLPENLSLKGSIAVDTEAGGLEILTRDRLCLVQLCERGGEQAGQGSECHLVQIAPGQSEAPRLKKLLEDKNLVKIFHYARFDIAILKKALGIQTAPIYCTKIASKIARNYSSAHGLKDLCREFIGIDMSKKQQCSDWGGKKLSEAQKQYAALDVVYLHEIKEKLDAMLIREERAELANECFAALQTRVRLDLEGWREQDIFSH